MSPMDEQWREDIRRWLQTPQVRVHLMGIGGIGMAGLARLLAAKGQVVSGCDAGSPRTLNWLRAQGIAAVTGHNPAPDWVLETVSRRLPEYVSAPSGNRRQYRALLLDAASARTATLYVGVRG